MQLPPLSPYLPSAGKIRDEIAAAHGEPDGPDHPLAAGFDLEFAIRFTNRAFERANEKNERANQKMTMPSGFLRVLNSGVVFEVLVKGKETRPPFLRLQHVPGGRSLTSEEGEIPEADLWLRLRLEPPASERSRQEPDNRPLHEKIDADLRAHYDADPVVLGLTTINKLRAEVGERIGEPEPVGRTSLCDSRRRLWGSKR